MANEKQAQYLLMAIVFLEVWEALAGGCCVSLFLCLSDFNELLKFIKQIFG